MFPDHHDSYSCHNANSNEEWRSSTPQETKPFCMNYNKQPVEVSVNSYPVATIEVDQVPSLFNISPCGPVYKYVVFFYTVYWWYSCSFMWLCVHLSLIHLLYVLFFYMFISPNYYCCTIILVFKYFSARIRHKIIMGVFSAINL